MQVTYIDHSGFMVESGSCYYIFDYYKGELPKLDKDKEEIVFCSHFHQDHFNPQIFQIYEIKNNFPLFMARANAEAILNGQDGQAHRFSGYWPSAVLRAMASTTSGLSSR